MYLYLIIIFRYAFNTYIVHTQKNLRIFRAELILLRVFVIARVEALVFTPVYYDAAPAPT